MRVVTADKRSFTFWLHQDDLSVAGCKHWLQECRLLFRVIQFVKKLRNGRIQLRIQGKPHTSCFKPRET